MKMASEIPTNALKRITEIRDAREKEPSISGNGCNLIPSFVSSKKKSNG